MSRFLAWRQPLDGPLFRQLTTVLAKKTGASMRSNSMPGSSKVTGYIFLLRNRAGLVSGRRANVTAGVGKGGQVG